jgi:hypothetical protein
VAVVRASITRSSDTAMLVLQADGPDRWLITNVLASGSRADPAVRGLLGQRLTGAALLQWATGLCSSTDVVAKRAQAARVPP